MATGVLASWKVKNAERQVAQRAKAHSHKYSREIDHRIKEDSKSFQRVYNILVMGTYDHDIFTMVREMKMKILHENGYGHEERIEFRPTIWKDLLETSRNVVQVLRALHAEPATPSGEAHREFIAKYPTAIADANLSSHPELAEAVRDLWADVTIPVLLNDPSLYSLPENVVYFFSNINRITTGDYIPSNEDILRAPMRTDVGVTKTYLDNRSLSLRLCHVSGQYSTQKKWIHLFEGVTSIIFCTPLSDYDVSEGDQLFFFSNPIINSHWFLRTSVILFLTRFEEFEAKIRTIPLANYFPEYTGGADVNEAAEYILQRFVRANNRPQLNVYAQYTSKSTDTTQFRMVFMAVEDTILQNAYRSVS